MLGLQDEVGSSKSLVHFDNGNLRQLWKQIFVNSKHFSLAKPIYYLHLI